MPEGIVRTDVNKTGTSFKNGTPVTTPKNFGTPVTLPKTFGTTIPVSDPTFNSNPVTWQTPNPAHYGNLTGSSPPGTFGFLLEGGSGVILLENGSRLLLEMQ